MAFSDEFKIILLFTRGRGKMCMPRKGLFVQFEIKAEL